MTQRVLQWSSPWILEAPILDPQPLPWEAPQESPLMIGLGDPGPVSWSQALPIQNDFYARSSRFDKRREPAWADSNIMGFYPGQPYMTPGVRPGIGGGWRAYVSGFPPPVAEEDNGEQIQQQQSSTSSPCENIRRYCTLLNPEAPMCGRALMECYQRGE